MLAIGPMFLLNRKRVDLPTFNVGLMRNKQQFLMMKKISLKWFNAQRKKQHTGLIKNRKHLIGTFFDFELFSAIR